MLVNFSNHLCCDWSAEQVAAASIWGDIVDLSFPNIPAEADERTIFMLADEYCSKICSFDPNAVLVQGEMSLSFAVVSRLHSMGIVTLCASSERVCDVSITEDGSTVRRSVFKFVRFRKYR